MNLVQASSLQYISFLYGSMHLTVGIPCGGDLVLSPWLGSLLITHPLFNFINTFQPAAAGVTTGSEGETAAQTHQNLPFEGHQHQRKWAKHSED